MKKIALLTSSRADYSIYLPLIRQLDKQQNIQLDIIAFGTHLLEKYGYTVKNIEQDGFNVAYKVKTDLLGDDALSVSKTMGQTLTNFADIWHDNNYDLIICLGDRYEMFAAVASAVAFNIDICHIHGGETTLGAIDNKFRHGLSLFSSLHFTTNNVYKNRVVEIMGSGKNIYNTGALSVDNLKHLKLMSKHEFLQKFNIDISLASILITFHPETVALDKNAQYADELINALQEISDYQKIITMPNADTQGNVIRDKIEKYAKNNQDVKTIESFGTIGYLTCMKHCAMLLGNTSSGFVEAAFFPKYVINIGDRQKGRLITDNILNTKISKSEIIKAVKKVSTLGEIKSQNIYGDGDAAKKMTNHILDFLN